MDLFQTIVIAIVEGLTEFLPVSSTGHMIIAQSLLGVESTPFVKAFTVIIQFGAILSVVCIYWKRFFTITDKSKGIMGLLAFYGKLVVGVIPAVVLGLLFNDFIERNLGNVTLVAWMLMLVGIFMCFCNRIFGNKREGEKLSYKRSFVIGLFQCISMIPGVSRSFATILGGMAQKMTRKDAAEFSFFLAVPTMFGATCLELYKMLEGGQMAIIHEGNNLSMLLIGCVVSFIVAILAIKFFISFLTKYGFTAFGIYRIIVGGIILVLLHFGFSLQMVG
jgi:undecaprenyl-diphosphatase